VGGRIIAPEIIDPKEQTIFKKLGEMMVQLIVLANNQGWQHFDLNGTDAWVALPRGTMIPMGHCPGGQEGVDMVREYVDKVDPRGRRVTWRVEKGWVDHGVAVGILKEGESTCPK